MGMTEIITWVGNTAADFWPVIILVGIISVAAIYKRIKEKKALKLIEQKKEKERIQKEIADKMKIVEPTPISAKVEPKEKLEIPSISGSQFMDRFTEYKKKEKGNVMDNLNEVTDAMKKSHEELKAETQKEFDELKKQLIQTNKSKEEIRKHGLVLSNLFEEYEAKEIHITTMMWGLEEILKKKKEE